jgi:hypothetical protein
MSSDEMSLGARLERIAGGRWLRSRNDLGEIRNVHCGGDSFFKDILLNRIGHREACR